MDAVVRTIVVVVLFNWIPALAGGYVMAVKAYHHRSQAKELGNYHSTMENASKIRLYLVKSNVLLNKAKFLCKWGLVALLIFAFKYFDWQLSGLEKRLAS